MAWTSKEKQDAYWAKVKDKHNSAFRKKYKTSEQFRTLVSERAKEWRKNNPDKAREIYRKQGARQLKLRFSIFSRDKFTCQYCGRKAPNVTLEIDHIIPKAKMGQNREDNYITSCKECNIGKGDSLLSSPT